MRDQNTGGGSSGNGWNAKGQWAAGTSGNWNGRPRKTRALSKSPVEHIADALEEMVPSMNAQGKHDRVPASKDFARQLVRSFPAMKPTEQLSALRYMDKTGVFDEMNRRSEHLRERLTPEQARERLAAKLAELRERQS